ncbi:MAG TPA: dihydrofolate reductase family protein [Erysipelothrix sp.]
MLKQKRNLVLFISSSLDGYIATKDESLEWLFEVDGEGDNGFTEFYETVDTVLMGRTTYDWIMKQDVKEFPYRDKDSYVFTRTATADNENVKFITHNVVEFVQDLKAREGKNIWIVGGGELLHTFIQGKIVDEFIITLAPKIIGSGIPLFKEDDNQLNLSLKGIKQWNQFVELHYERKEGTDE